MTVYVVTRGYDYEGEDVVGVHSTLAGCWEAMRTYAATCRGVTAEEFSAEYGDEPRAGVIGEWTNYFVVEEFVVGD